MLSVTTDRIVLEDIYLGPLQIRLDWQRLGLSSQPYRVVALDPHPAAKSDDITHPHVQDEQLCEGEGRSAIRAALAECRLHDFFLLVSQVLHTYGQGSAYVELDDWDGVPCEECGASLDEDDRYCCQRCEATLCGGCSVSCQDCGDSYCSGCIGQCAACDCELLLLLPGRRAGLPQAVLRGLLGGRSVPSPVTKNNVTKEHEHDSSENARNEPVAPRRPERTREPPSTLRFSPTAWAKLLYSAGLRRHRGGRLRDQRGR